MKKFLLFALAAIPQAYSQCTEPFTVPYEMDTESLAVPALPDCSTSYYNSFASQEEFLTIAGPLTGYSGNVLAYSTAVSEFAPPEAWVSAVLYSPGIILEQGVNYLVSYKYGNSDAQLSIDNMAVTVNNFQGGQINIAEHVNITGAIATQYTSAAFTVPVSGTYQISFNVFTQGTQGVLYLDDIEINEAPTMDTASRSLIAKNVYPNPVTDILQLNNDSFIDEASVYNVTGQAVYSIKSLPAMAAIDMGTLPAGIYLLSVSSGSSQESIKIIKK
jgi:hypothetical protein